MQKYDFSIHSQEDEDLRCPICSYYFSNITKPLLLPCNHNLCSKCIDSIVNKKMNTCPICRNPFTESDRKNFQVNFAFLNLVVKILKTKVIFCKKCGKIFNWIDHHSVCDQIDFKETNEIVEEIKRLTEDCFTILKYLDKHKNIMVRSKSSIYDNAQEILKIINLKFNDHFHNKIENFFKHVPELNIEAHIKDLYEFLKIVKPLHNCIDLIEKPEYSPISNIDDAYFTTPKKYKLNFQNSTNTVNSDKQARLSFKDENSQTGNRNYTPRAAKTSLSNKTIFNLHRHKTTSNNTNNTLMNKTADGIKNINSFDIGKYLTHKSRVFDEQAEDQERNSGDMSLNESEIAEIRERSFSNGIKINHLPHLSMRTDRNHNLFLRNSYEIQEGNMKNIDKEESPKIKNNSHSSHNTNILNFNYNFNLTELIDDKNSNKMEKEEANQILKNKQKIVVRNDKIEILNSNGKSKNFVSHFDKSSPNIKINSAQIKSGISSINNDVYNISKFETNQAKPTDGSPHETINEILLIYNKTKEIVERIRRYTNQVEFTSESIKNQISSNYNYTNENILRSLNSLCDNLTLDFKPQHRKSIINLIEGSKKIWIFDVKKMKCETKEFVNLNIKLSNSSSVEFDDMDLIFITGGKFSGFIFDSDSSFTNIFLILRWSNKSIELNSLMPRKRAYHSSIYLDNKLYVIGGCSSINSANVSLRECECYDIIDKRWELLPQMNSARCNPSVCIYNGRYLYAFRGWTGNTDQTSYLDTIDYLNVKDISQGWTSVTPADPGMCWYGASHSAATVFSDKCILICGGSNASNKLLNHTFIYDPILKTVYRSKDLVKSACFNSISTIYENSLISIDTKNETNKPNGVHVYDLENKKWKFNQS